MTEQTLFGGTEGYAEISDDGRYRYVLGRQWGNGPLVTFVMQNPSTADAGRDDRTIHRCMMYARRWGAGGLHVVNLYALRSTDPRALWTAEDPVGPDNDKYLAQHAHLARREDAPLIAAWGGHARPDRIAQVLAIPGMDRLSCLGVTLNGRPKHPLARGRHRIPDDVTLQPWPVAE